MGAAALADLLARPAAEVRPWLEATAGQGIAEAQLRLGGLLLEEAAGERDRKAALGWFLRAARKGHAGAMNMAGRCHENGWGTLPDDAEAAGWYRRSAAAGDDWGAYNYAHMLFDGRGGVAEDRVAAFALYRHAAENGHARAMNLVARCLETGWGVAADPAEAAVWYRRSAEAGYFRAQFNHAAILAQQGRRPEAIAWLEAARAGGDDAMCAQVDAALASLSRPMRLR